MTLNTNKLDPADTLFSKFIRLRDGRCKECGRIALENANGERIIGIECSHYHIRAKESVRFDPKNTDSFCPCCHDYYGSHRAEYTKFKKNQLGEKEFNKLEKRSEIILDSRDRTEAYRVAKKLYDDLKNESY